MVAKIWGSPAPVGPTFLDEELRRPKPYTDRGSATTLGRPEPAGSSRSRPAARCAGRSDSRSDCLTSRHALELLQCLPQPVEVQRLRLSRRVVRLVHVAIRAVA